MPKANGSVTRCNVSQFTVGDDGLLITEASDIKYQGGFVMIKFADEKVIVYDVRGVDKKDGEIVAWNLNAAGNQDYPPMMIFND